MPNASALVLTDQVIVTLCASSGAIWFLVLRSLLRSCGVLSSRGVLGSLAPLGLSIALSIVPSAAVAAAPTSASTSAPAEKGAAAADRAAAQVLFDEGRELMDQGRAEEACPRLEESERLESRARHTIPPGGVL